jgi:hypothetical protein
MSSICHRINTPALRLHVEPDAKTGGDRWVAFPMTPVLQPDLSGADFLAPKDERNLATGADGICRIVRFGCDRFDDFLVVAIDRPAEARGRVLRQLIRTESPTRISTVRLLSV